MLPESLREDAFPNPGAAPVFVGRTALCALLDAQVASVAGGGSASVVTGEPGIGKSALLRRLAEHSPNRVIRLRGVQGEASLPYAGLADLFAPVARAPRRTAGYPAPRLEVVLTLADGRAGNVLAVCAGTLTLIGTAGDDEPLVVLVDDLPGWMPNRGRYCSSWPGALAGTGSDDLQLAGRRGRRSWVDDLPWCGWAA